MKRPSKTHVAAALTSTVAMALSLAPTPSAATPFNGSFDNAPSTACHGLAAVLPFGGSKLGDANPGKSPCITQSKAVAEINLPLILGSVKLVGVEGHSLHGPDGEVPEGTEVASAGVARVAINILGLSISAEEIQSEAAVIRPSGCAVTKFGQSRLGRLRINGAVHNIGTGEVTLSVLGFINVHVNQSVQTANTITQRSLFLDFPGTFMDLVISQASAGTSCDGPVTIASAVKQDQEKPSKEEVESLKKRIKDALAAEKAAKDAKDAKDAEEAPASPAAPETPAAPEAPAAPAAPEAPPATDASAAKEQNGGDNA